MTVNVAVAKCVAEGRVNRLSANAKVPGIAVPVWCAAKESVVHLKWAIHAKGIKTVVLTCTALSRALSAPS